jgi:hypothetical protein
VNPGAVGVVVGVVVAVLVPVLVAVVWGVVVPDAVGVVVAVLVWAVVVGTAAAVVGMQALQRTGHLAWSTWPTSSSEHRGSSDCLHDCGSSTPLHSVGAAAAVVVAAVGTAVVCWHSPHSAGQVEFTAAPNTGWTQSVTSSVSHREGSGTSPHANGRVVVTLSVVVVATVAVVVVAALQRRNAPPA